MGNSSFCPEGAFCVGEGLKIHVRASLRPSGVRPCAIATNQQILGKNLQIRVFSGKFLYESSKAQNMRAGRVDKN